jgi:hypothetical protein
MEKSLIYYFHGPRPKQPNLDDQGSAFYFLPEEIIMTNTTLRRIASSTLPRQIDVELRLRWRR